MEFAFYYTEVTWCWWEESKRKTAQEAVVVCATSYSHAAGIIEENYGDELVSIDKIEQISEDKILPLSILSGRALRDAAHGYGSAEIIEEKDFSKLEPPTKNISEEQEFIDIRPLTKEEYEEEAKKRKFESINTPCEDTFAQNFEGIAP